MPFRAQLIACLIANKIAPTGCGVDSLRDCNSVDCVLVDFDSGRVVPELGTLEWINFNPDFLILISIVETFHFSP